ncbi:MAG: hypothetical protein ACKO23_11075 [Gemmataceae bacterium]
MNVCILAISYLSTGFHVLPVQVTERETAVLLREVSLPPPGTWSKEKAPPSRPSLGKTDLEKYADTGEPQENLRERLREAQQLLWITSPALPPKYLLAEVQKRRRDLKTPALFADQMPIPTTPQIETRLKTQLMDTSRVLARLVASLEKTVDDLKNLRDQRDKENLRWQANYDLTLAWLMQRIVYLEELSLTLGQMRKEWPVYDAAVHKNWQVQPSDRLRDIPTKKRAREAEKLLKELIDKHPDTIWATMANEALKAPLSLEWKPVK